MKHLKILLIGSVIFSTVCVGQATYASECQDSLNTLVTIIQANRSSAVLENFLAKLKESDDVGATQDLKICKEKSQALVDFTTEIVHDSDMITDANGVGLRATLQRAQQNCK